MKTRMKSNTGLKSTNDSVSSTTKIATTAAATTVPQPNASSNERHEQRAYSFEDTKMAMMMATITVVHGWRRSCSSKGPPSFVPKVVIRDTPVERPSNSAGFSAPWKPLERRQRLRERGINWL